MAVGDLEGKIGELNGQLRTLAPILDGVGTKVSGLAEKVAMGAARRRLVLAHGMGSSGDRQSRRTTPGDRFSHQVVSRRSYHSGPFRLRGEDAGGTGRRSVAGAIIGA